MSNGMIGKIRCKHCDTSWDNVKDYLASSGCEKDNCPMAKKWKARQQANAAIEKAQESSKEETYVCHVKTCSMENQYDETQPYRERPLSQCISFHVMKR